MTTTSRPPERFYTAEEAAEKLRVPASWLKRQARAGQIPRHKVGRYVRFTDSDLAAIEHQTAEQPIPLPTPLRRETHVRPRGL